MKQEIFGLFVPSVVFTFLVLRSGFLEQMLKDPRFWIIGLFLTNAYCLSISQMARFSGWNPFKYLWIFSVYLFVPFFVGLFQRMGLSPVLAPFAAFSTGLAVEYVMFKDVSLKVDLLRLVVLTFLVREAVNRFGCLGCR